MSRFYASIQGNRGEATRGGSAASGIYGHIRGWHIGARVDVDARTVGSDLDVVRVELTGGSTESESRSLTLFRANELPQGGVEITVYTPSGEITWEVLNTMPNTTHKESHPGYVVYRFHDGVGFACGRDPHVWLTWRMDGLHHAHPTTRRFKTVELARNDIAARIRFYRILTRHTT